jgi:cell division protein FtsQ
MSTLTVDPRLRARRVKVARDAGRRRLRRLTWLGVALGVVGILVALTFSPVVDVEAVSVAGEGHTSADAITGAAGVATGDSLVWFDPGDAVRAIEALPWVAEATVERSWSGSVTIEVTEREAVAAVAGDDGWFLADGTGRLLQAVEDQPTDLPVVQGVHVTGRAGEVLDRAGIDTVTVAAAVPPSMRSQVATISSDGDDVAIALREGGAVVLGGADDAPAKLASAAAVLATVSPGCVQELDVSVAASPALVSIPGCT